MVLHAENISKRYMRKTGQANWFEAVAPLSLALGAGEVTVLVGRSGSGKSTLLHMLAGLLTPTQGKVFLDDTDLYALPDARLSRLRGERIGVVPQARSLVDALTVWENVLLPGQLRGGQDRASGAEKWLEAFGIAHLRDARPAELSGGELRRVAIARALAQEPDVLLADEPTGDLDDGNTRLVLEALRTAAREEGRAVLLVTHEADALAYADRAWRMDAGRLEEISPA